MKKIVVILTAMLLLSASWASASPFLVSDPHDEATCYEIRILNETPEPDDDGRKNSEDV